MKLLRYGEAGMERPAILDADGVIRDLSGIIDDVKGATITDEALQKILALNPTTLPEVVSNRVLALGNEIHLYRLNYGSAAEAGLNVPAEPIIRQKPHLPFAQRSY